MSELAPLPVAELSDEERIACLRLIRSNSVGPASFRMLINTYGGAVAALAALPGLARRGGRKGPIRIPTQTEAEDELAAAASLNVRPLFTIEPGYPRLLALLEQPPPMVHTRGNTDLLNRPSVAIVGSRDASANGLALTRQLASELAAAGLVIVSGLARGIDGAAHHAALPHGTVAVLAGGIDQVYPPEHGPLQEAIAAEGCLLSDQPLGLRPRGKDFPRRNRLISGLSLGVALVEAATRSGSLITARFASEQGREVFAVPGHPLDPRAAGTNLLIREGATLITSADDVITALKPLLGQADAGFREPDAQPDVFAATAEQGSGAASTRLTENHGSNLVVGLSGPDLSEKDRVLAVLGPAPVHVDDVARATQIAAGSLKAVLLELSLAGRIEHHGGQLISLRPPPR